MAWAPAYVSTAELKSYLNIGDTVDDTELDFAIEAASRAIDQDANRQFGQADVAEERFYTGRWDRLRCRWVVDIDDLADITDLDIQVQDVDGVDLGAVDLYALEPRNGPAKGRPYELLVVNPNAAYTPTGLADEVAITALWGWASVPGAIKQATLLQASRLFARRTSPYGIAGSPDLGSELRLLARLDVDVAVSLRGYRRWWAGA